MIPNPYIELVQQPIDQSKLLSFVEKPEYGAIVTFLGIVRNHHQGKQVSYLEYSAYEEMALQEMQAIALALTYQQQVNIAISHRLGRLDIGDCAVMVVVATAHRHAAFELCHQIIDQIKARVPIFKKEFYLTADGCQSHWVGIDQKK